MEDAETYIRRVCARLGWEVKQLQAIPGDPGYVEVRAGRVALRVTVPMDPEPGFDPWDQLRMVVDQLSDDT